MMFNATEIEFIWQVSGIEQRITIDVTFSHMQLQSSLCATFSLYFNRIQVIRYFVGIKHAIFSRKKIGNFGWKIRDKDPDKIN